MEYLLLATFAELFSTTISYNMLDYNNNYIYKKIGEKGYKVINNMAIDTIDLLSKDEVIDKVSKIKLYIPIYNLFYSKKIRDNNTNKQINRLIEDGLIAKMSESENNEYSHIKDSDEKMVYVLNYDSYKISNIKAEQPKERYIVKSVDKLKDKYTSNEVEALSSVFENQYILGTVNNEKVAILGVYDCDLTAKLPRMMSCFDGADFKVLPKDNYGTEMFTVYTYKLPSNNKKFLDIQKNIYIARNMVEIMAKEEPDALTKHKKLVK